MTPSLRFVVLRHDCIPDPHYDVMVERSPGSVLQTWRSQRWPVDRATPWEEIQDHRPEYLHFEGTLSGNRGSVKRVASGFYSVRSRGAEGRVFTFIENGQTTTIVLMPGPAREHLAIPIL